MKQSSIVKEYICPKCHEKQTIVNQWLNCSVVYKLDLQSGLLNDEPSRIIKGPHESWSCPACGFELDNPVDNFNFAH